MPLLTALRPICLTQQGAASALSGPNILIELQFLIVEPFPWLYVFKFTVS